MTTDITKTYQGDALIETREIDSVAGTFTRRDGGGITVEQRPLNPAEAALLDVKLARETREADFQQAKIDAVALTGNGPVKRLLIAILDELDTVRSSP